MSNAAAISDRAAYHGKPERKSAGSTRLLDLIDNENIAKDLSDDELGRIGETVSREFGVDEESRADWKTRMGEAMDLALQVAETKNYPWPKAANIKFPLLTTGAIQFAARAYPAIIDGRNVVKGQVTGNDDGIPVQGLGGGQIPQGGLGGGQIPQGGLGGGQIPQGGLEGGIPQEQPDLGPMGQPPMEQPPSEPGISGAEGQPQQPPEQQWQVPPGAKRERADRIGRHMSWQLLEEMEEWEEDTDQLLHILPITGCVFRKTWFDPNLGRNRSELITAENLVINYKAKNLETAPRITQCFELYPHEVEERFRMDTYKEFDLPIAGEPNDDQAPHEFLEQHRWEDLDDDGYPEPYIVTTHKDTNTVVRIVARYDTEGVLLDGNKVVKIVPVQYFTRYLFMPSPDGGIYGLGLGSLLKPMNEAVNTAVNQMLDAGHLQNTGGGFLGSGLKIKGGVHTFRPGEWKRADTGVGKLSDNIVPLPAPGPSPVLFQLLGLLIEAGRDISSVKDVMTGDEGPSGEAATRTLARIEQGLKVFSAIYKRVYRSLKQEYKKLFRLNRLYMEQEQYFTFHDNPEAIGRDDYESESLDVAPVADPGMVTDMQKMAHAEFLMGFINDPFFDPIETRKQIVATVGIQDADRLIAGEPPQDPQIALQADELEIKKKDQEIKEQELQLKAEEMTARVAEIQSKVILNIAKADSEDAKAELQSLAAMCGDITANRKLDIEERKRADTRELGDKKNEADERRVRNVAGAPGD